MSYLFYIKIVDVTPSKLYIVSNATNTNSDNVLTNSTVNVKPNITLQAPKPKPSMIYQAKIVLWKDMRLVTVDDNGIIEV